MKSVVGEIPSGVAARATCLADKEFKPLLCFAGDGVFIAVDPAVEGGCAGDDGSFVSGNRAEYIVAADPFAGKQFCKPGAIFFNIVQAFNDFREFAVHLHRCGYGACGLIFQRVGTTIPEQAWGPGQVQDGWCVTP